MTPEDQRALLADAEALQGEVAAVLNRANVMQRRILAAFSDASPPAATLSYILISPASFSVTEGGTVQLTATAYDQFNNAMTGVTFTWSSSASGVASINSSTGLVTGVAAGTASLTASATGGVASTPASCTVSPAVVASVAVSPAALDLLTSSSPSTLTAEPRDASGNALSGRTVTALSSDTNVVAVSMAGYACTVTVVGAGTANVTLTCETVDAAAVAVTVTAATSNEPAGTTNRTDRNFASKAASSSDSAGAEGWDAGVEWNDAWTVVSGASTEVGASPLGGNVAQHHWSLGRAGGSAPQGQGQKFWTSQGHRTLYVRYYFAVSSTFDGHSSNTNKQLMLWCNNTGANFFTKLHGKDSGTLKWYINAQGSEILDPTFAANGNIAPNMNTASATITRGVWYKAEVLIQLNAIGSADGRIRGWVNGVQTHDYAGRQLIGTAAWWQVEMKPIWGGTGDATSAAMDMWFDGIYLSTAA